MTQILLRKDMGGLRPDSDEAYRVLGKVKNGTRVVVDVKDPTRRSTQQHRFWFAMANMLFESQEYYTTFDHYRQCLLISMGYCDVYKNRSGDRIPVAHSLKFGKMSQDEFNSLVESTLSFAESIGFDRAALLAETQERAAA